MEKERCSKGPSLKTVVIVLPHQGLRIMNILTSTSLPENLSIAIGIDCLNSAATDMNIAADSGNLLDIVVRALTIHPESHAEVILAGIALHDDARSDKLRGFILEVGRLL